MMGNFLTTLGNTPAEDRETFEELGLNVARQADNGSNPRPDNRSGWLEGETPDVIDDAFAESAGLEVRMWDPGSQLRYSPKRAVPPRPDGAPNTGRDRAGSPPSPDDGRELAGSPPSPDDGRELAA
jgi:biotin synthase